MVVHRHGQGAFGFFLANHIVVEVEFDVQRGGQAFFGTLRQVDRRQLISNDVVAQINAFIANKDRWAGDEFFDLVLTLTAERAVEIFL